jgi:hypothetical protein
MNKKRIPKSKDELKKQMEHSAKIERQKKLARIIFPMLQSQKTIYDAQTAVNAVAGFIKSGIALKMIELKVKDVEFDLSKEKNGVIKDAMLEIHAHLMDETADEAAALLERFGNGLGQFASSEYMKNPMSSIDIDKFIA